MILKNKKGYFDYEILIDYDCGIKLIGSEVKSIRNSDVNINQAYCYINNDEIFIKNMYIGENKSAVNYGHEPLRDRKLLLKKKQIINIQEKLKTKGLTLIPLILFEGNFKNFKLKIGVGRGKKDYEKRSTIKDREAKIEIRKLIV